MKIFSDFHLTRHLAIGVLVAAATFGFATSAQARVLLGSPDTAALSNGLVGYWPLDGAVTNWATGKTSDLSGKGNAGLLISMSTTTSPIAGKIGQAFNLNGDITGSGSGIDVPHNAAFDVEGGNATWAAWIYPQNAGDSTSYEQVIFDKEAGSQGGIFLNVTSNRLCFYDTIGNVCGSVNISNNKWYHIAFVKQGTRAYYYVNGVLDPTSGAWTAAAVQNHDLGIGMDIDTTARRWKGYIDDVRIYSRALSPTEVKQLYALGTANYAHSNTVVLSNGLVGYWTFDGAVTNWATGQTQDLSGQGKTGTLVNMSTTTSPIAGTIGQALKFDGGTQEIVTNYVPCSGTVACSISAWFKTTSTGVNTVVGWGTDDTATDAVFNIENGVIFSRNHNSNNASAGSGYNNGKWHVVTIVKPANATVKGLKIYVDGVSLTISFLGSTVLNFGVANNLSIAGGPEAGTGYFNGTLDDVRVYNRALSPTEVKQLYALGTANYAHSNTVVLSNGLVGYWTFDGAVTNWATGQTLDLSGQSNTGQLVSMSTSTSPVAGKIGQALKFNGSSGYVSGPISATLSPSTITFGGWIKTSVVRAEYLVHKISTGNPFPGWALTVNSKGVSGTTDDGQIACWEGSAWLAASLGAGAISNGKWHNVYCTYDGTTANVYFDGALVASKVQAATISNSVNLQIGRHAFNSTILNGTIDDVRVYNRALSAGEVQQIYNMGR